MLFFSATELYNQAYDSPMTSQKRRKDDGPETPVADLAEGEDEEDAGD